MPCLGEYYGLADRYFDLSSTSLTKTKSVSRGREMIMAEYLGAKTVVLVHGGFVDGSGWEGVYNILRRDGYTVAVAQNPTISLADDVAVTKRVIDA